LTITNTILRNDYVANGSSTVFSFTFIVLSETAGYTIQVITTDLIGVETIKTQGVDYTVQLNDNGLGTITFLTAPILNHKITLLSNVPNTQETDYIKAGTDKFPAESHEKALDKLTLISKQFLEKFNRIVSLPKSSTLANIEFPINSSNANQILAINNDGTNLTTTNLADIGLAPVSAYIKTLLDDVNSSQARATLDAQQLNANLTALAGLAGALNKLPYFTGSGAMALQDRLATATNQGLTYLDNPVTIANNTTDPDNDIDFSAGNFEFSDRSSQTLATAMTKRLDATWSAGSGNGGLFNGTAVPKAINSTYHCYKIYNPTTGEEDSGYLLGISGTAPDPTSALPAGYTKYKRVGSVKTNASGNIRPFFQKEKFFEWAGGGIQDYSGNITTTEALKPVSAPLGIISQVKINYSCFALNATANKIYLRNPALTSKNNTEVGVFGNNGALYDFGGNCEVFTNNSSEIYISTSNATNATLTGFIINTLGYYDYTL
jgi:hypothetical protein